LALGSLALLGSPETRGLTPLGLMAPILWGKKKLPGGFLGPFLRPHNFLGEPAQEEPFWGEKKIMGVYLKTRGWSLYTTFLGGGKQHWGVFFVLSQINSGLRGKKGFCGECWGVIYPDIILGVLHQKVVCYNPG